MVKSQVFRVATFVAAAVVAAGMPLLAEQAAPPARALTADDYARAERFMGYNTTPLVFRTGACGPTWLPRRSLLVSQHGSGREPSSCWSIRRAPRKEPAFDHARLAAALSTAASAPYTALTLPFTEFELTADGKSIEFGAAKRRWRCDRAGRAPAPSLGAAHGGAAAARPGRARRARTCPSPDGTRAAFVRDYNLWVRESPAVARRS